MVENDLLLDFAAIQPTLVFFFGDILCCVPHLGSLPSCTASFITADALCRYAGQSIYRPQLLVDDCVVMRRNPARQSAACTCVWVLKWISYTRICTEGLHFIASTVCVYNIIYVYINTYISCMSVFSSVLFIWTVYTVFISPQNSAGSETSYCSREFTSWSGNRVWYCYSCFLSRYRRCPAAWGTTIIGLRWSGDCPSVHQVTWPGPCDLIGRMRGWRCSWWCPRPYGCHGSQQWRLRGGGIGRGRWGRKKYDVILMSSLLVS